MKNTRNNGQKQVKNCLKWTASGLLLAMLFVLVFAGTLSGAFGVEENLVQNGKIDGNVASAASQSSFGTYNFVYDDFTLTKPSSSRASKNKPNDGGVILMKGNSGNRGAFYAEVELNGNLLNHVKNGAKVTVSFSTYQNNKLADDADKYGVAITSAKPYYDSSDDNWGGSHNFLAKSSTMNDDTGSDKRKTAQWEITSSTTKFYVAIFVRADGGLRAEFFDIKIEFTYSYDYSVAFSATTGGKVSKATDNITGSNGNAEKKATSTASVATPGYHFVNWTKGDTTTEYSQNKTIEIGSSDYFEYNSYKANFALNRLNVVYWQNHTDTDNTTWTDTFTYKTPKAFRNLPKNGDKTFVGWSTSRNGAVVHAYDTSFEVGADKIGDTSILPAENHGATVDLYAVWVDSDFGSLSGKAKDSTWGSQGNPFVISTSQHLKNLSDIVNGNRKPVNSVTGEYYGQSISTNATSVNGVITFANCYFVIASDIGTATGNIDFVPIGKNGTYYFAGTIYGGNESDAQNRTQRTIYLNISQSGVDNVGLFGYVKGASISYIKTAGTIVGGSATGGLVGCMENGEIFNCANSATVTGRGQVGGIVGSLQDGTIRTCFNSGKVTATGNAITLNSLTGAYLGGIVGYANGNISNCYNEGEVTTGTSWNSSNVVGGIAGYVASGKTVTYCYNKGAVSGSNDVGGIVGNLAGGISAISYCYQDGRINGLWSSGSANVGVIAGNQSSTFSTSWKLPGASVSSGSYTSKENARVLSLGTNVSYVPVIISGNAYTERVWTDILTIKINGFKTTATVTDGKFLASATASNGATSVVPAKIDGALTANANGGSAQQTTDATLTYWYNANTSSNIYVQIKNINGAANVKTYNGANQTIDNVSASPFTATAFYFDANYAGTATDGKMNAGTYSVIVDVVVDGNVVGRKLFGSWTINTRIISQNSSSATYYYGARILSPDIADILSNIVNGHSVTSDKTLYNFYDAIPASGSRTYTITYTNIRIVANGSDVTGNYKINNSYTFTITVNEGDFGVYGTTDIEKNPWGSPHNPYVIGTKEQLTRLSAIVGGTSAVNSIKNDTYVYVQAQSGDYSGAYFKLADNIPSVGNITPIGSNTHSFAGNFDGNNKTISGLNISVAGNNVGLFGYISGATIKNLTVNGSVKGSSNVGGVVGYALNSTIENVTNNASISSTYKDAPYEIKQFDAHPYDANEQAVSKVNDGDLSSKYYSAKKGAMSFIVQNTTLAYIFGFAITNADDTNTNEETRKRTPQSAIIWGSNNDFQRDNYTSGGGNTTVPNEWGWEVVYNSTLAMPSTSSDRKEFFSGFKLRNYKYYYIYVKAADNYSTLQFAEFDLLTTNSQNVGGVVGYAQGTSINKATNTASVEGDTCVGGIVGYADSTSRMYGTIVNSGNITANSMVGGVSGENHGFWCDTNSNYGTFKNSGSINGRNGATVGGVTAFADKEMCNAENTGNVIGGNAVGGVAGRVQAPIKNSYNSGEIVGTNPTAQGEISGNPNGVFVGGITGYTTVNGTISNCYNKGHIAAHSASGDYINNGDYVGGIVGFAQAKVEYCANIGGLIEGNNFIGGIVGSALDNTNIDYCYDVQGQRKFRWDGCNHGSITGSGGNVTNSWAINEKQVQTTANNPNPVVSTKGYRLTTAFAVTPQVDLQNTTNQKWEDILSSKINGFKVVGSVGKNQFFCSDNGSDTNTKYVKPSKTEGFAGDNGDVTTWYSATIASNIRVRVQNITLPTIGSKEYDGLAHGFGHTTYPNTANGAAANNPIVYTTEFLYVGTTYKENLNVSPTNVDVYNTTVTIKIDGQIVGVKKGDTVTITERLLKVSNVWTSASEHVAGDTSNVYIFHYNTQHQGIIENGISVASVHGEFAIPQDVYTIGGYVETKQAHNDTTHTRTFTLNDIRNYKIENKYSQYDDFSPNTVLTEDTSDRGISEATVGDKIVVTYTWKIVPYSLATNITSGNVWFGGTTDLIVGNQGIANVNVGNQSYADKRFYPLQSEQNGVQKVLVYAQHNYAADKFVLYVKYNNGTVAVLTQGTEYTLSALDAPTVENPAPLNTSVTASGKGNFDGDITKYYTAMFSDFGWKKDKSPSDEDWGSQDNPYVISKPEHLLRLSQIVNGGTAWNSINTTDNALCIAPQTTAKATSRDYKDAYFLVTVDIDMSGYISTDGVYNFLPIGTRSTQNQTELPFSATFDGGDNTITYVYNVGSFYNVDGARKNYVGLFGYLNGATISNLKVASNGGLSITDNDGIVGIEYVGGIAGYAVDSTLYNSVLAYGGWVRGETYVGGIVGYGERITIVSSEAVSSANVGGETYVGGIVGKWIVSNQSQIGGSVAGQRYVTPADQIDVMGIKYVGGIAGWMDTSSCATTISYAPQLNNNGKDGNFIVVGGIEYVGALFGAFIGNGYHQNATNDKYTAIVIDKDASDNFKVGNVKVILQNLNDKSASGNAKVVGGLVGYAEGVGILFNTDWTTSNVTLDTGNYTPSFIGGIAGVLGKNATIEAIYQLKDDGTFLTGGTHTITHSVPDEQKTFGTAAKPLGSFVGGIVGYVSSQAGVYWETGTTIFGNGISLVNLATIYATSYAGGIFGALGDLSTSVAQTFENDTNSILYNVLTTGVRSGNASTTLGLAPTVSGKGITAQGRLVNNASISVSGSYVGGIAGYCGAKVRFVLRNTPQDSAIDVSKLNIYSGGSDIFINGSYAGGIAGYLVDNLEHDLQYIVVKARFNTNNQSATRVGGLVGYMGSGNVQNCVVTNGGSSAITASTDTYQGSEYVGGLVGETQNATIRNSVSTGFNLEKTSNTKGGLLGYGANPTIDSSWTFYIAKKRTNFAKNATPNGAYYATVSQSPYGKYILVDEGLINATEASYPTFVSLCGFVGLLTNANVEGTLEFAVKVPNKTLNSNYENTQLAFYNASGSDTVTDNVDSFSKFENKNNTLTIALDMASGNSMQICVVGIEFVNVAKWNSSNPLYSVTDGATKNVENSYKKPSDSDSYSADVTNNNSGTVASNPTKIYDDEGNLRYIQAIVYFNGVIVGATVENKQQVGQYDSGELTPGSSATTPYTISNQQEWNDFAYSIYSGANNYSGKYVKLLTDSIVINTGNGGQHAGTKGTHNFGATVSIPSSGTGAPNNIGYNFAGDISKDSNVNNFRGTFDGNGHYITINYVSGGYYRVSAFPNAADATFRNLTIKGKIQAASQMTGANGIANSAAYDVAGFVGKPFGSLKFYNCTNEADIIGLRNVAGLVGYNSGGQSITFEACVNIGDITSLQGSYTLGGYNNSKYNYDDNLDGTGVGITNIGYTFGTGGIIGAYTGTIQIESCRNAGTIIGGHNVGGIIGLHEGTSSSVSTLTINNCANSGEIRSNSGYWGEDEGQIGGDASRGVRQSTFGYAGGLVGKTGRYSILKMYSSYNSGWVVTLSNIAGGLVGSVGTMNQPSGNKNSVLTGGRSVIAYCYNVGKVNSGGTFPKRTKNYEGYGRENFGGAIVGGVAGLVGNIQITQTYNAGEVWQFGIICYGGSWQVRAAGIVGQSQPTSNGYVLFDNVYNVGTVYVRAINTQVLGGAGGELFKDARYGAAISGYCDTKDAAKRIYSFECYSINNCVSSLIAKDISGDNNYLPYKNGTNSWESDEKFDEYYQNGGIAGIGASNADLIETGMVYNTYDSLTAAMNSQSKLYMNGSNFAFSQSNAVFDLNFNSNLGTYTTVAAINSVSANAVTGTTNTNVSAASWVRYPDSWLYVYGCLPQLSVFALDTQNSLSMRSIGYGQDQYGEFNENGLPAGSEQYPFIIKDGIDLMGMQALVDTGYSFVGQYIEVANGENNLDGLAATRIKFPTYASTGTAATDGASNTMFKAVDKDGSYKVGKSYHLLLKGAVFNKARNEDATYVGTDYGYWAYNTYYYNGAYNDSDFGDMRRYGIFRIQNFIPMGRGNNVFKGHFSGKQDGDTSTIIDDLRITTGKDGGGYGGLFAKVQDAYIGYISIGGTSKVSAYSYDNSTEAGAGGIVGKALGSTVIENCGVADSVQIGAYGRTYKVTISSDGITFAGGIAGVADPIQGNSYNAGITLIIRNCSVSTSGIIESAKSNIGGVLGYVGGDAGASGKGNTVRIEGCSVDKAVIQAASSANTSSQIGGILGYGSQYVAAFITGCKVGVGGAVSIKGEHSLGGIAGGMSNAKGGYIDSCIVGAKTSIERINQGGDKDDKGNDKVSESPKHGTAIGGLVGFTQDSKDDTSPLTTTFSGTSAFGGTITVSVESTNKSQDSDAKISCIGGIVGDMGSGANFASGSDVTVGGTIDIKNSQGDWLAAANVGGVAGRTSNATFIGKFDVSLTMNTLQAENVGGFIGKNVGTVYILADTTERIVDGKLNGTNITIGGTIQGTSEVGGFIGVNNSGSSLNIGSNVANAKPYRSGTLSITIENGTITGGDNVGGIVGKNEGADGGASYATIDIVKGTITQQGTINGANNVGGIIGLNDGLLTTGGGEADTSIGGIALSDDQIGLIKNLSITNIGNVTGSGNYVGGVVGKLDSPATLRTEDSGKGAIAGTFTNSGTVVGNSFVGGSLGFVGKNVTITAKNNVATLFVNDGQVTATGYFVGGSIGALVGKIQGENSSVAVKFENKKKVNATGFVGGSIGVLAGPVSYAQFVNSSGDLTIAAVNSVGGSVGYIGVPSPLSDELVGFTAHQIDINNTHFEASGNLTANPSQDAINAAKKDKEDNGWGGVGGAIGVMGAAIKSWTDNTYYANGNVKANVIENGIETGIYNVGGIVGLINAGNITISNMLAYRTTVTGGKNVGGIVGATNGTNTKILSAYTIEGTFSGTENVGGIIGLANSTEGVATDAKTSYWVKGYTNAILAGTDVKNLQQDLGKFETIIEHVGEQPIVFTEEFCKMYTPKTYYDDYPGTHTYNGKTITLGENVEQLTWYDYFKDKLGETSAQIKNGAWVKPIANAPTYTTGANNTGWYFVYATDKTIGTINAEHSANANLQYWKRIADAYTSSERNEGKDDNVKNPLASDIVLGNGAPQKSTLYATATAAGTESGYYLYMATSGKSRPSATNQGNKFYIQTLTTNADALAENVAVYYRTISKGKALTFNGYLRYAPVGITASEGETVSYIKNPETATGKPNSYCYSADTTTAGGQGTDGAQTNPGSFHSQVNIYYFDSEGKPHVVGGVAIGWTINKRDLNQGSELRINSNTREYGTDNTGDNHDVVLKIANIAPGAGEKAGFVIEIKSDNETIATFTWNGTSFTGLTANAGKYVVNDITISAAGESNSQNNLSDTDLLYNVNEPGDKVLREFSCYIDFKHAKKYDIEVKPSTAIAPNNNKQWAELYDLSLTGSFTVSKKELKITGEGTVSPTFNGENHGYRWKVSGIVTNYGDTIAVLAAFSPQVCAYVNNAEHSKALYTSPTSLQTGKVTIDGVAGVNFEVSSNPTAIDVSANNEGSYYVKFATTEAGNYTLKLVNGDQNKKETNRFGIAQNTFTFTWNGVNGKHVYNGTTKGVITLTISTTVALTNLKEFIDNYFDMTMQNGTVTYSDNKAYVTFTTDVNAGKYYAKVSRKTNTFVNNNLHNCAYPSELKTNTQVQKLYTIDKRNLTLTLKGDGTYIYNTEHQGLTTVNVNAQSGDVGIISGDSVKVSVVVTRNGEAYYTYSVSGVNASAKSAGVNTINHGVYVATASDGGNSNYDIATDTANWTINKKELKLSGLTGGEKVYDGTAHTPTLKVNGDEVTNGTIPWGNDTISIKFSATLEGDSAQKESLVNVGKYSIKIGGTSGNAIAVSPAKRPAGSGEVDTSDNYTISGSDSTTYEIKPRPITVTWNTSNLKFVYDLSAHGLTVSGINGGGTGAALQSSSLDYAIVKTGYGNDAIKFTLQGKKVDAGNDYEMSIKSSALNGRIVNDEVESTIDNYVISGTTCEKKFEIEKSQIIIKYAGGTTSKVYDAGFGISGTPFVFNTESQNGGAHGTSDLFDISYVYKDKNVGNDKEVVFTYVLKQNANYEYVGTGTESQNKGQITPAHIRVALDKLRSGKATRTYTDDEFYGGAEGATGNGRSKTYRTGEGFTVSGVLGSDNINVVARYQEADNTRNSNSGNYFDFSKYVNDVYKDADGTFKKASAGKYFKKLVFTMTGTDAANYTFNVYDSSAEGGNKYSESDSTAAAIQSVTVYDSRDSKNKNASGAASIQIEITVKSVRVEYSDTAQSYANDDNTYNTNWKPITGTNKDMDKADAKIKVSNGWMYVDGKDHTAEEGYTKREYRGYTTIRGSQNSERLGAKVDPTNGMDLNYRLSNQPTLTIAYFVSTGDEYEINSLARLLIASFYYTASQNPGNLEIIKIVSSGYKWVSVVSADDYDKGEFELPQDTPITDSKATTWDEYFTELEAKGYSVFLNIEANAQDNIPANTWGYYATTTSESSTIPTSYKLTKDIVGKFTESDISILNTFFTVIGDDGKTTTSTWSGNGTYLKNVLKAAEGKIATINGSLFVSTAKTEEAGDVTGFGGTFDGNGYVIEYLNIMGYGKDNVGLFDVIGANGIVKNLHLRNVTINGNAKYVGGIAGKVLAAAEAALDNSVNNVSFHGSINVTGSTDQSVGGLFGISERAVENAIVLGSITVSNVNAKVGGVVGTATAGLNNVVSMMQITASGGTVGAFTSNNAHVGENCTHMTNAVWKKGTSGTGFENVDGKNVGYNDLMSGSVSGYGTTNKYYHESETSVTKGEYDVLDDVVLTKISVDNKENARQSMRLADIVKVYLLMYSLNETQATDSGNLNGANVYAISTSSWLVGTADGTSENAIFIANKQNVSLLRELRFASFTLKANVSIEIASTFSGAFYGSVTSATNESGTSYGYKITCDKAMFEAYSNDTTAWLSVQ